MSGVVLLYQVPIEDIYLLRNAFYRCSSIMKNGYGAKFFGVSDNVEDFPPCHPSAFLNFGMGMVYFTRKEEAERFLHTDRALNEAEILKSAEVSIVPLGTPLLLGEANKYTFLITHLLTPERDSEMSDHKAIRALMSFGAVPLNSAHEETSSKEGDVKHICCGIRIIQLPAKEIFYEWIKSDDGKDFRKEVDEVGFLNSYVATFGSSLGAKRPSAPAKLQLAETEEAFQALVNVGQQTEEF
ncbi:hypothetical protein CSKR_107593 [Clonorchis sinensis]|uniref:Uncharacterized protein n=1 Tax=Clonorchis sinensis TaxID=79923 RepID=A0A3R7G3V6_CLOSI|nr:hypothetical protein CSKR_107593 [Clonorchis sinensis]